MLVVGPQDLAAQCPLNLPLRVGLCGDSHPQDQLIGREFLHAEHVGFAGHVLGKRIRLHGRVRSGECHFLRPVDIRGERDGQFDAGYRVLLAHVADARDLAVADVPERAVDVAHRGDPKTDRFDLPDCLAEIDDVADPVLVLEQHEDSRHEVAHEILSTESDCQTDHTG